MLRGAEEPSQTQVTPSIIPLGESFSEFRMQKDCHAGLWLPDTTGFREGGDLNRSDDTGTSGASSFGASEQRYSIAFDRLGSAHSLKSPR